MIGPTTVGKSTLINAILGGYFLPAGNSTTSTTGIATRICNNGDSKYTIAIVLRTLNDIAADINLLLTASRGQLTDLKLVESCTNTSLITF